MASNKGLKMFRKNWMGLVNQALEEDIKDRENVDEQRRSVVVIYTLLIMLISPYHGHKKVVINYLDLGNMITD